jgi:ParB family chromosome partitioning protein
VERKNLLVIQMDRLRPDPNNVRTSYDEEAIANLATSLTDIGQQQPIRVRWMPEEQIYQVIQGHCRYFAAIKAGLPSLQAVLDDRAITDTEILAAQLVENTARTDLTPIDCAKAVRQLIDLQGLTQQQAARKLGRSQAWVSSQLQLLDLSAEQQTKLAKGTVSITEARAAVVKQPRSSRKKPKQIKLTAGGITVLVTFKRVADQCSASEAWERVRSAAEQLDAKQAKDAA